MTTAQPLCVLAVAAALAVAGCGRGHDSGNGGPTIGLKGSSSHAAQDLGFPTFATKNTTRVGGGDATADAAAIARAVYPAGATGAHPDAVTLVDSKDWRVAVAASVLMAPPVRAPVLYAQGGSLPGATQDALSSLHPTGSTAAGGAQVIRVGSVPKPGKLRTTDVTGKAPFELAGAIDRLATAAKGSPAAAVVVASADAPDYGMPAAAWAAKSGDPVLFVTRNEVPAPTIAALQRHDKPNIYVLGPRSAVGGHAVGIMRRYGTVLRIGGNDPVTSAIAFARFQDGSFGWGVTDPGHGLVFANASQPLVAAAAAPLSASGTYGPLLLVGPKGDLPPALVQFLLDIQPGYQSDPAHDAVYNHGWLVGDAQQVSPATQSRIDALLEVSRVTAPRSP